MFSVVYVLHFKNIYSLKEFPLKMQKLLQNFSSLKKKKKEIVRNCKSI